nr:hypothetical protein [Shewanella maritima]
MRTMLSALVLVVLTMPFSTSAKPIINVGGYEFSPYVTQENDGHFSGLTIDLIAALNQVQNEVEFNFVPTSIEQRTSAYSINRFDLMLFESPQWGWQTFPMSLFPLMLMTVKYLSHLSLQQRVNNSSNQSKIKP